MKPAFAFLAALAALASDTNWPQFRGVSLSLSPFLKSVII
jgi:hypothetical protein